MSTSWFARKFFIASVLVTFYLLAASTPLSAQIILLPQAGEITVTPNPFINFVPEGTPGNIIFTIKNVSAAALTIDDVQDGTPTRPPGPDDAEDEVSSENVVNKQPALGLLAPNAVVNFTLHYETAEDFDIPDLTEFFENNDAGQWFVNPMVFYHLGNGANPDAGHPALSIGATASVLVSDVPEPSTPIFVLSAALCITGFSLFRMRKSTVKA